MNEFILKQEEMLQVLNRNLDDIERLLIGDKCCEEITEFKKECLLDVVKNNGARIDNALHTLERIAVVLRGGEN